MRKIIEITIVIIVSLFAGAYMHRCQHEQSESTLLPERKVYDTIPYLLPKPQEELAIGTSRYTLPKYYFIGTGAGGEPRCSGATETTCLIDSIGLSCYGIGAGGEPRCSRDSAIMELPIIQRHYADSTYEAWISGPIDPRLDSLQVFAPTTIITKQEWKPPKKWHIGPTIGYGYTSHGFEPYIGVCITYSILSF